MDNVNSHDTALLLGGDWYVARHSAAEVSAASRRAERKYWIGCAVGSVPFGVAIAVVAITAMESVSLLSWMGALLVVGSALISPVVGVVLAAIAHQGDGGYGPKGTIPWAVLSARAARHLTPEARDRLAEAEARGLLDEALALVEQDAGSEDRRTVQEIMRGRPANPNRD